MDRTKDQWGERFATCVNGVNIFAMGADYIPEDHLLGRVTPETRDKEFGGWYSGITSDGKILPNKQCYAHAFVILAASSAILAGKSEAKKLLQDALDVYDLRFWNEEEGLSCDTWNTEFTKLDSYRGINANMHTVEAFLAAADVTENQIYRIRAGRIIRHVIAWAGENDWRIPEHFTSDWIADLECNKDHPADQFKPYGATPGHGIEWARLIVQWAVSTYQDDEKNQLLSTVWPGKSDLYHAFQATLIPYNRVDLSIACAIKEKKDGGLE